MRIKSTGITKFVISQGGDEMYVVAVSGLQATFFKVNNLNLYWSDQKA